MNQGTFRGVRAGVRRLARVRNLLKRNAWMCTISAVPLLNDISPYMEAAVVVHLDLVGKVAIVRDRFSGTSRSPKIRAFAEHIRRCIVYD